jgi:hypothetical protein
MDMEKINHTYIDDEYKTSIKSITNRNTKYETGDGGSTDKSIIDGNISSLRKSTYDLPGKSTMGIKRLREHENFIDKSANYDDNIGSDDEKYNILNKLKNSAKSQLDELKTDTKNLITRKINNTINGLINDTLGKIRKSSNITGMSSPQNVYDERGLNGIVKGNLQEFANQGINDILGGLQGSNGG